MRVILYSNTTLPSDIHLDDNQKYLLQFLGKDKKIEYDFEEIQRIFKKLKIDDSENQLQESAFPVSPSKSMRSSK